MTRPDDIRPPDALLEAIARDLRPVRPAALPWRRVVRWVPLAAAIVFVPQLVLGLREDAPSLGPLVSWGLSALEVVVAVWLVWMAAREGVPSRRLPVRVAIAGLVVAGAVVAGLTVVTFAISPTGLPSSLTPWHAGRFCFAGSLSVGAPLVLAGAWLLVRWFAVRPWLAGALAGAGAGLAADAGWRLACPISDPSHVLTGHAAAVVTLALAGAVAAHVGGTWRRRGPSANRPR